MGDYYDRYALFKNNGITASRIPFMEISKSGSDIYIEYDRKKMRMDMLSYKYYGDPNLGWLILQANPSVGGYEYNIETGTVIRIPYPKDSAIKRYEYSCNNYLKGKID